LDNVNKCKYTGKNLETLKNLEKYKFYRKVFWIKVVVGFKQIYLLILLVW